MSDSKAVKRRSRGGGGAARRAERTSVNFETAKYIERNIPLFNVLNDEALEIIETNAEAILEGVELILKIILQRLNVGRMLVLMLMEKE